MKKQIKYDKYHINEVRKRLRDIKRYGTEYHKRYGKLYTLSAVSAIECLRILNKEPKMIKLLNRKRKK